MTPVAAWLALFWIPLMAMPQGGPRWTDPSTAQARVATVGEGPTFTTASVAPNPSNDGGSRTTRWTPGGGFQATHVTLRELVAFAYQQHAFDRPEVIGGPPWMDGEHFDVAAQAAGDHVVDPDGTPRQSLMMLRALLASRFGVAVHEDQRARPVYVLAMATTDGALGPGLRRSDLDCSDAMKAPRPTRPPGQGPPCGLKTPPGRLIANTFSMPMIASLLSRHLDRPVIDRTGLAGRFDIELEASEITPPPGYTPGPSDLALPPARGPSIFVAVREQLGLTLEPQTVPVAVIVIDAAERPRAK